MVNPLWTYDRKRINSFEGIIGVDEAGRGCLAGPVVAGAVLLPTSFFKKALNRKKCADINDLDLDGSLWCVLTSLSWTVLSIRFSNRQYDATVSGN